MEKYVPGVCNIGPAERQQRFRSGIIGAFLTVIMLFLLLLTGASRFYRLGVFFPAFAAAIGFLQSYFHFCAAFGLAGLYNVTRSFGETDTVVQAGFRRQDKLKAFKIILLSFFAAAITALIAYLI